MEVEGRITGTFRGGDDDGKILGPTSGQDRVDGSFFDGQPTVVWRHLPEQLVPRPPGAREHPLDTLTRRRHDGEPIAHALVEPDLEFVGRCHAANAIPPCRLPAIPRVWSERRLGDFREFGCMTLAVTKGAILGVQIEPLRRKRPLGRAAGGGCGPLDRVDNSWGLSGRTL